MATTVLCLGACSTGSVAKTAAAPQIALPDEISKRSSLSSFNQRPRALPNSNVPQTIMQSIATALGPITNKALSVSLKPYRTIPVRKKCLLAKAKPPSHCFGNRGRIVLANNIPTTTPRAIALSFMLSKKGNCAKKVMPKASRPTINNPI